MVKTLMPRRILTGLLASRALGSAVLGSKDLVNDGGNPLVLFKRTTDDAHLFFVGHGRDSFLSPDRGVVPSMVLPQKNSISESGGGLENLREGSGTTSLPHLPSRFRDGKGQ